MAQAKFVHTVSSGYVCAAFFLLGVSAWYLLKGRHIALAKRSMTVAAAFGLAASLSAVVLGDESGYLAIEHQKMKLAAIEGMWETEPAPAPFTAFGFPDQEARETHYAIHIPFVTGLIATRTLNTQVSGSVDLVKLAEERIRKGIIGFDALQTIRATGNAEVSQQVRDTFEANALQLGYAYLLRRYVDAPRQATPEQISQAA